jgi:16S rRNA (cytosine1402-N4)-methyltransferase
MKITEYVHTPVLLDEVLRGLKLKAVGVYVDCTYGRGGHSKAILKQIGPQGRLLAIDKDPDAILTFDQTMREDHRFTLVQGSYTMLENLVKEYGIHGRVDGILFDLGVSSPQFDDPSRGFSFQRDGQLDMRMDSNVGMSASDWLNSANEDEIRVVLHQYGEERYARKIAKKIVKKRSDNPIMTTCQLAELLASTVPTREKDKHPATRTFQAIRIFINHELDELRTVLAQTVDVLTVGGRLLVISFHSLEDRMVKRFMRDESRGDHYPPEVPVTRDALRPKLKMVGKVIHPTAKEIADNPRARSAVLRIAERIA